MSPRELERLLEAATNASRVRDAQGRLVPSGAWMDLDPAQRERLYRRQLEARTVEAGLDPRGLSSTGHAVLRRIGGLEQFEPG